MSKIKNSVYGLALGDSVAYRTEFLSFESSLTEYWSEHLPALKSPLIVSDDTQMSLYLLKGFKDAYDPAIPAEKQKYRLVESIAKNFIDWLNDPENCRAPGNACIASLMFLSQELEKPMGIKGMMGVKRRSISDFLAGGTTQANSKGSGTVMRSPWIGVLHAEGIIQESMFELFCNTQSAITHQHPTALHASYLTALLTSRLYKGELEPGQVGSFAMEFAAGQEDDLGWRDIIRSLDKLNDLPGDYHKTEANELDPSSILGSRGTAEDVLTTAIAIIDHFGDRPLEVLRRSMFNSGDSDTIGAVAGGMLGAFYDEDIWTDVEHLLEEQYVPELQGTITYMESLTSKLVQI